MLYISRKPGQAVIVDNAVEVRVVAVRGRTVKLGFRFPPTSTVLREEVYRQVAEANRDAAVRARALAPAAEGGGDDGGQDGDGPPAAGGGGDGEHLRLGDHAPRGGGAA